MSWNPSKEGPPSREVQNLLGKEHVQSVLDAGCGWGRNLAPFVGLSHTVHGFDIDAQSVEQAELRLSKVGGVRIWHDDIRSASLNRSYSLVLCLGVLHFLTHRERLECYRRLRYWTEPNGVAVVVMFNALVPIPSDLADLMPDVPANSSELLDAFADWQIMRHDSYVYDDEHDGGAIKHTHSIDRLTVRRPI